MFITPYGFGWPCGSRPFPSPALTLVLTFISTPLLSRSLQQFGFYPKGSNPHPSPALTLLFTFMTSSFRILYFFPMFRGTAHQNIILFRIDATYDGNGPSVLNKQ
jgi:hypothetical protein